MRKRILACLLVLALLCTACGQSDCRRGEEKSRYDLCFLSTESGELTWESTLLPEGRGEVDGLLTLLLAGPQTLGLSSPIPRGTVLRGWRLEDGLVTVDLSELYGGLSEVDLSQADGCIVMTLCQLESVDRVCITVEGRTRPFRDKVYSSADFLLTSGAPPAGEVELTLWFLREEGLDWEMRTVRLAAGDRAEVAALQALLEGPQNGELLPVCPEGTPLLSVERSGDCFTVDLGVQWLEGEEDARRLRAIAETLWAIGPEMGVTFRVEGLRLTSFAGLNLTEPLRMEETEE